MAHTSHHTLSHTEKPLSFHYVLRPKCCNVVGHINRLDCILLRMRFSLYPRRPKTPRLTSPRRSIYVGPRRRTGLARPRGAVGDMCGALAPPAAPSAPVGGRAERRFPKYSRFWAVGRRGAGAGGAVRRPPAGPKGPGRRPGRPWTGGRGWGARRPPARAWGRGRRGGVLRLISEDRVSALSEDP